MKLPFTIALLGLAATVRVASAQQSLPAHGIKPQVQGQELRGLLLSRASRNEFLFSSRLCMDASTEIGRWAKCALVADLTFRDPAAFLHRMLLAVCFFGARDYAFALVEIKRAMVDAPQMGYLQIFAAYINAALGDMVSARAAFGEAKRLAPELVQRRLNGVSPIRNAELRNRATLFLRIAAGLEDPSAADAYR